VLIRPEVEVSPCKHHDDVEEFVLEGDEHACKGVEFHCVTIVGGVEVGEEDGGYSEEGKVFDVGIVAWVVGDN
jgi:hypothetical protein